MRALIRRQIGWSRAFDRLMPEAMNRHGGLVFVREMLPELVRPGMRVVDVGSGRHPTFTPEEKERLGLYVVGLDLSAEELRAAPAGGYDETIVADVTRYRGDGDADLVVSRAVLEHLQDTAGAFRAMASMVRPGGTVAVFVPSGKAMFARLNRMLPRRAVAALLRVKPDARGSDGWPAFYDRCTPAQFRAMAADAGLETVRIEPAFISTYFQIFTPAYVAWRLGKLAMRAARGEEAAETFCAEFRRPAG